MDPTLDQLSGDAPAVAARLAGDPRFSFRVSQLTPQRWSRMVQVALQRSRRVSLVLEDIYQGHNASAILRTADCFGVQDVHAIERRNRFKTNDEIALGASQWLSLRRWTPGDGGAAGCLTHLKSSGFRIAVTTLAPGSVPLEECPIDRPLALVLGTELTGVTDDAARHADIGVRIGMFGFTQSFNVSVSAALCLHSLMHRIRRVRPDWRLPEADLEALLLAWLEAQTHGPQGPAVTAT